jgi:hypothetical protein
LAFPPRRRRIDWGPRRRWASYARSAASLASRGTTRTTRSPRHPQPPPRNSRMTGLLRPRRRTGRGGGSASRFPSPSSGRGPGPCWCPARRGTAACRYPREIPSPLCDDGVGCTCAPESTGSGFMERAPFFFFFLWCLWCAVALVSGSSEVWTWTCWDGSLNSGGSSSRSELLIAGLEDFS